jgi:hypothetical protein
MAELWVAEQCESPISETCQALLRLQLAQRQHATGDDRLLAAANLWTAGMAFGMFA